MQQISFLTSDPDKKVQVEMSVSEYLHFLQSSRDAECPPKRILKGIAGIMETFGCSRTKAWYISQEEWFQAAKVTTGRCFAFDADLAWRLAQEQNIKPAGKRA